MVCTSWVSFAVSIEAVPGRLGLLLTILLMLINMNNSISQTIPKSDGICPLILWILISIIFIVFALVEYFIILTSVKFGSQETKVATKKRRKVTSAQIQMWATSLDKTSLMVFPLAYFFSVLIFTLCIYLTSISLWILHIMITHCFYTSFKCRNQWSCCNQNAPHWSNKLTRLTQDFVELPLIVYNVNVSYIIAAEKTSFYVDDCTFLNIHKMFTSTYCIK